jgi:hypothetical protein
LVNRQKEEKESKMKRLTLIGPQSLNVYSTPGEDLRVLCPNLTDATKR